MCRDGGGDYQDILGFHFNSRKPSKNLGKNKMVGHCATLLDNFSLFLRELKHGNHFISCEKQLKMDDDFYFDSFPKYRPVTTGAVSIISIFQSALVTILPLLAADLGFFGEVHGPHLGLSVYPLPASVGLRGPLAELKGGWAIFSFHLSFLLNTD